MSRLTVSLRVFIIGLSVAATMMAPTEARIWKDKSGKHTIDAEFLTIEQGVVHLKRADGKVAKIRLVELSKEDQEYLRQAAKEKKRAKTPVSDERSRGFSFSFSERSNFSSRSTSQGGIPGESEAQGSVKRRLTFGASQQSEPRTPKARLWSSSSGKHKILASFVSLESDAVKLRRDDGKEITVPLSKLSDKDQAEAEKLARITRDQPSGNESRQPGEYYPGDVVEVRDPFDGWKSGKVQGLKDDHLIVLYDGELETERVWLRSNPEIRVLKANPDGYHKSTHGTRLARVDRQTDKVIAYEQSATGEFQPDELVVADTDSNRPFTIEMNEDSFFHEFVLFKPLPKQGVCYLIADDRHPGQEDSASAMFFSYNLRTGEKTLQQDLGKPVVSASVSPSGKRMLTTEKSDVHGQPKTLDVWDVSAGSATHVVSWNPFDSEFFKTIDASEWIDDEKLIVTNANTLHVWDVPNRKLLWKVDDAGRDGFKLSNNQKQLAVATSHGVMLLDSTTGEILLHVESPSSTSFARLSFSPSGRLLAATSSSSEKIDLINLETATCFDTLNIQSKRGADKSFFWADGEHILIGGEELLHFPSKSVVWNYKHKASAIESAGGYCWYLQQKHSKNRVDFNRYVTPLKLPHSAVSNVDESQLSLKPGDSVALELELVTGLSAGSQSIREATIEKLQGDLSEAGYVVALDGNANATLRATMEPGESKSMTFRRFGDHFNRNLEKVEIVPSKYRLEFLVDNQVVWRREQTQAPSLFLELERDESIRQAIDRIMRPSPGFFGLGVPSRVLNPEEAKNRFCTISPEGIVD